MNLTTWYLTGREENDPAGLEGAGPSTAVPADCCMTKRTRGKKAVGGASKAHRDEEEVYIFPFVNRSLQI